MGDLPVAGPSKGQTTNRRKFSMMVGGATVAALLVAGIWVATTSASPDPAANGTAATSGTSPSGAPPSGSAPPLAVASPAVVPPVSIPTPSPLTPAEATAKATTEKVLAAIPQPVAPAVAIGVVSKPQRGVTATVGGIQAVDGKGRGPGQISGPAVRFTVTLTNGGTTPIDTGMVVVNVDGGPDHIPALVLSGPGVVNFPASLAPGQKASGTFVFLIPNNQRNEVRIFFNYDVSSSIVAFEGAVPKAQG
ncbi:hypothetical protein AAGW05_03975 [Arthrobacter sp. LAPM80]|uniref:hypothetical protein n=1 Tax=Arthrobacter sp. LAPM80 TaxID=3141788 RepID=UPI00398B9D74